MRRLAIRPARRDPCRTKCSGATQRSRVGTGPGVLSWEIDSCRACRGTGPQGPIVAGTSRCFYRQCARSAEMKKIAAPFGSVPLRCATVLASDTMEPSEEGSLRKIAALSVPAWRDPSRAKRSEAVPRYGIGTGPTVLSWPGVAARAGAGLGKGPQGPLVGGASPCFCGQCARGLRGGKKRAAGALFWECAAAPQ